jgi:hypothetical protein
MSQQQTHSRQELHRQTARISWPELEPHFARGVVIAVNGELDLVEVATAFANDERSAVEAWLAAGTVRRLPNELARDWATRDAQLWAVVTAPWVLVQERRA